MATALPPNESPVNLFKVDTVKFPKIQYIEHQYSDSLAPGDCMYIPAYYWYQVTAEAEVQ